MHAEIDAVLGSKLPTFEDVPRLNYIERVFTEAMRLYPPVKWKLRLGPGHPVKPQPLITLRPKHGMKMTIERRRR